LNSEDDELFFGDVDDDVVSVGMPEASGGNGGRGWAEFLSLAR
jgi:hypothetical protein